MATIHFLNVGEGDCIIIQHNSGRVSMIDISCGNITDTEEQTTALSKVLMGLIEAKPGGNFGMSNYPTRPQTYLKTLGISQIWRFILTHPDMDHLDGFDALLDHFKVFNFWHSGAEKEKPDFGSSGRYNEDDWDHYEKVRDNLEQTITTLKIQSGHNFKYANEDDQGGGGDGLTILAPNKQLVDAANGSGDFNDCSYVILYRTAGFKVIFSGDSHDATWEHVLENHSGLVTNCDLLIAPHHGRGSGRSWDFLNVLNPRFTLFGYAKSEHLAYDAWNRRGLEKITNNQAGNIVVDFVENRMNVYIENDRYAKACGVGGNPRNSIGYIQFGYLEAAG